MIDKTVPRKILCEGKTSPSSAPVLSNNVDEQDLSKRGSNIENLNGILGQIMIWDSGHGEVHNLAIEGGGIA